MYRWLRGGAGQAYSARTRIRGLASDGGCAVSKQMLRIGLFFSFAALCPAQAPAPPTRFAGTIVSVSGDTVTLADKGGKPFIVSMTPGWTVSSNRTGQLEDLKPGEFIASANAPVDASTGKSTEVRILEPGYRPEQGTHPVSSTNSNMMTHGTVTAVHRTSDGLDVEVTYPNGSRHLLVSSGTPVTVSDPKDRASLKPGLPVEGVTRTEPDGVLRASRIQWAKQ